MMMVMILKKRSPRGASGFLQSIPHTQRLPPGSPLSVSGPVPPPSPPPRCCCCLRLPGRPAGAGAGAGAAAAAVARGRVLVQPRVRALPRAAGGGGAGGEAPPAPGRAGVEAAPPTLPARPGESGVQASRPAAARGQAWWLDSVGRHFLLGKRPGSFLPRAARFLRRPEAKPARRPPNPFKTLPLPETGAFHL